MNLYLLLVCILEVQVYLCVGLAAIILWLIKKTL